MCTELVSGCPDFIGVKHTSGHGVGGIIVGETRPFVPTVFQYECSDNIKVDINTEHNPSGRITNSDLETAGLLMF